MFKKTLNGIKLGGFIPFIPDFLSPDKIENATKTEKSTDISKVNPETGWDRLRRMYRVDEFGNITVEANSILQTAAMSMFVGCLYGGTMQGKDAYQKFMKNNQATTFTTHLEAKQKLQEAVSLAFGKGAFKWGWRLALFSSTYVGVATMIQVYRGKYGFLEYVSGGIISGFLYKFNAGPRAWVVGAGLGSVLGLICGGVTTGILKASGMSMEESRYWQYQWKEGRSEYYRKGLADYLEKEDFAILKLHNDEVGEAGTTIHNLDNDNNDSNSNSSEEPT